MPALSEIVTAWAEKHSGLGGWVGAIGSLLAILAAWLLARGEYMRTQKKAATRRKEEIDLISKVIADFEALLYPYISALWAGSQAKLVGFYAQHINDSEHHGMRDLAHIPVTQWPSLPAYVSFKRSWIPA